MVADWCTVKNPSDIYHPMNRGDRREPIFRDDSNRLLIYSLGK